MVSGPLLTFLFTDVEQSTQLWENKTELMAEALATHDEILRRAIREHGGTVFSTAGDAFAAAFETPESALSAAEQAQSDLAGMDGELVLAVRMGIHTGAAEARDGDYFGPTLNRTARIMSAGHGGQVLVSAATAALVNRPDLEPLGVHRLKDLSAPEEIHQLGPGGHPPLETLDRKLHNLPVRLTSLVGRDDATNRAADLVRDNRVVTLLGIGGSGKTRLSQAVAVELIDDFPDGVWFVDLVPVGEPERLAESIGAATSLKMDGEGEPLSRLSRVLGSRRTLLVLDNCEHLTEAVADVVEVLVHSTSAVHVLATSREPLELVEEYRFAVEPLQLSEARTAPAMELFQDAAARVGAEIQETELDDAFAVCRHLDGLPLALELAGAQLRQLTVGQLRERMDNRFGLLTRGRRSRAHRQASLQQVLDDTIGMLVDDEWALLSYAAAFPSTFDLEALETVTRGVLEGPASGSLAGLVDRHLVVADEPGRFRLLETVKLFVRQRWDDETPADDRPSTRHMRWLMETLATYPREARYCSLELATWINARYDDVVVVESRLRDEQRMSELTELYSSLTFAMNFVLGNARTLAVGARIEETLTSAELGNHERGLLHNSLACGSLGGRRLDWLKSSSVEAQRLTSADVDPVDHAAAMLFASWGLALSDTDRAVDAATEAAQRARAEEAFGLTAVCHAYQVNHLLVGGRMEATRETAEQVEAILHELAVEVGHGWVAFASAAATLTALTDPRQAMAFVELLERPELHNGGSELLRGIVYASLGDLGRVSSATDIIEYGFRVTGDTGLPDMLLMPATLAWRRGDIERSARCLTAIRHAPKPTQNFLMTSIYRQLRDQVGLAADPPSEPIEQTWAEARRWMAQLT